MIYLDNNASTRIAPEVVAAMQPFLDGEYGNPSSAHAAGRSVRAAIERSRSSVAKLVGARAAGEIVFTGTGTEADNWAITGSVGDSFDSAHIVTSAVEHGAVARVFDLLERRGCRVTRIPVDEYGALDLDNLRAALSRDTRLVSLMMANNETGVIFPIAEIAKLVREHSDAIFHVDGVNAVGKVPVDLGSMDVDLFSMAAHKFYGPKGIGALYVRSGVKLPPVTLGGGQEFGLRSGTEAVHQIVGMEAAADLVADMSSNVRTRALRDRLESAILETVPDVRVNGPSELNMRLPNTSSIGFGGVNGEMLMARLDAAGICVSTGSACHTQDLHGSGVLQAMNVPFHFAKGTIRFSFGRYNTDAEVDTVISILPKMVNELRSLSGQAELSN